MKTEQSGFRSAGPWVRLRPWFLEALRGERLASLAALSSPRLGRPVTTRRSSWVRTTEVASIKVYIKTYDYPTPADRRRGIGRTTLWAHSRARREWDALEWLAGHGFCAPQPLLVGEERRFGLLRRAVLVTEAWDGRPLDALLPQLEEGTRSAVLDAVFTQVRAWHAAGFRDRNLDPRNLLVRRGDRGWVVAKIDSPRYRLRRPGPRLDRLARADWARLERGLAALAAAWPSTT